MEEEPYRFVGDWTKLGDVTLGRWFVVVGKVSVGGFDFCFGVVVVVVGTDVVVVVAFAGGGGDVGRGGEMGVVDFESEESVSLDDEEQLEDTFFCCNNPPRLL